jgi:alpha-glucosidase
MDTDSLSWHRGGVIYQIYPRSFLDSNGDGVGDLAGVAQKLDYVASLDVDGVWLSPFYRSPQADFGYDISDYRDVDPTFGTLQDFDALLSAAHARGLKVIVDQVYSHTSDQHPWFAESRQGKDNPKADWYIWADPKPDGTPPNNWLSVFGGPGWSWEPRRRQYYQHAFLAEQPRLNFWSEDVRRELLGVAKFWLDRGADGFRLDTANYYVHDPRLRDNPAKPRPETPHRPYTYQDHIYEHDQPETLAFLEDLRRLLDRYPDAMTVAEVFSDAYPERLAEYTRGPSRLHTGYGFWFLYAPTLTAELVRDAIEPWSRLDSWPSWSFSNHDVVRAVTRWGGPSAGNGGEADPRFAKLLLTLLLSLRGTIFLYQGEELGLPQARVPPDKLKDPEALRFGSLSLGRDGARTPMPWTAAARNAGFSPTAPGAEPWLPLDARHAPLAVDAEEAAADSILQHARRMIRLRHESPALRAGDIAFDVVDGPALAFTRRANGEEIGCLFNLGHEALAIPARLGKGEALLGEYASEGSNLLLPPYGALLERR